ncbi:MAG: virulence factor [Chloroflexota bacterium]
MSGKVQIIYWRDIPSQVKGKVGRKRVSRALSDRFMQVIDAASMKSGDTDTDVYLAQWKPGDWIEIEGDTNEFLDALVAKIESEYPAKRLGQLVKNGGYEPE